MAAPDAGTLMNRRDRRARTKPDTRIKTTGDHPDDRPHKPGTITVYILYGSGRRLSASVPIGEIDEALESARRIAEQIDGDARCEAYESIAAVMRDEYEGLQQHTAETLTAIALWLACTGQEPHGSAIRERLRDDCIFALVLVESFVHGKRVISGRAGCFPLDTTVDEIIERMDAGQSAADLSRRFAPH
jgi:hypothetical protein